MHTSQLVQTDFDSCGHSEANIYIEIGEALFQEHVHHGLGLLHVDLAALQHGQAHEAVGAAVGGAGEGAFERHDAPAAAFLRKRHAAGVVEAAPVLEIEDLAARVADEQALRCDLHHFIFICEPKEVVQRILNSPWNRVLNHRLYAYRDEKGEPVEISNAEMERFKTVIKRYDFQIVNGDPTDEVREGDQVTVVSGPMAGTEGVVKQIRERKGQILLTVVFSMFLDKMHVAVPGISIADVRLKAPDAQQLLQDPVIAHFEDELIELLCHLHGKKGSHQLNKDDQKRLRFLYQYSDIVFEDNAEAQAKFSALMLICAYLMNDKDEQARRLKEVETLLANRSPENSQFSILNSQFSMELEIYLLISLFIVNHNPELRQQAKAWRQSHPDCPLSIRRLLSIAKQIRC